MNLGTAQTTQDATKALLRLCSYYPFRYGGKWHVASINGEGYAYRSKRDLQLKAVKAGLDSLEMAIVE